MAKIPGSEASSGFRQVRALVIAALDRLDPIVPKVDGRSVMAAKANVRRALVEAKRELDQLLEEVA